MKGTNVYTLEALKEAEFTTVNRNNKWVPARPIGLGGFWHRLHMAWLALTGQCDLIRWPEGQ